MTEPRRGGSSRATGGPADDGPGPEVRIGAVSGYGARTRLPFVDVTFEEAVARVYAAGKEYAAWPYRR